MSYIEGMDEQLFDRYEKRNKTFSQIFNATMIFALAFLTVVLIPFVILQQDEKIIEADLVEAREKKETIETQLTTLAKEERRRQEELEELSADRRVFEEQLVALKKKREQVKEEISSVEEALKKNKEEKLKLKQQMDQIDGLKSIVVDFPAPDVDQFVTEIRAFLRPAQGVVYGNKNIDQLGIGEDCPNPNKDQFFNCLVRAKVMQELSLPYTKGPRAIVPRMAAVDPNLAGNLEKKINATIKEFDTILSTDPGWWQELTKKFHVGEQFKKTVEDLLEEINGLIEKKSKNLGMLVDTNIKQEKKLEAEDRKLNGQLSNLKQTNHAALTNIMSVEDKIKNSMSEFEKIKRDTTDAKASFKETNQELDTLNKRLDQITSKKEDVTDRIKNVESPFGTLPVGLNEALQIFPVVVSIGALMYWTILSGLISLRYKYHMALRHRYTSEHAVVDSNVVLFAPLFIDPQRDLPSNLWRGCVLAIPIVVYAAAVALILYSWSLDTTLKGASTVIRNVYMVVYVIGFFLILFPIARFIIEWRNYRQRFSAASKSMKVQDQKHR